jgi:cysteinyl-tRNA synthetase
MVTVDGQKMGKSLGNFTYLKDIFREHDPMVVRLYILRSHYRSPLDFSAEGLSSARSGLERLVSFRSRLGEAAARVLEPSPEARAIGEKTEKEFVEAMDDDLNTPGALAVLFEMVRSGNSLLDGRDDPDDRSYLASITDSLAGDVLGLDLSGGAAGAGDSVSGLCEVLGRVRGVLRGNRLFEEADEMRDRLEELGYVVKDLPEGGSEVRPR